LVANAVPIAKHTIWTKFAIIIYFILLILAGNLLYPEYFIRNMLFAAKSLIMIGIQMYFDNILKWQIAIINRCAFHPVQARK
jgi:hypothetical protein